jgi:PAS domain S-box-containing protein
MKTKLIWFHIAFLLALSGIVTLSLTGGDRWIIISLGAIALIVGYSIFYNWMKLIASLATQSGRLHKSQSENYSTWNWNNLEIIQKNQELVEKKFKVSTELIANLTKEESLGTSDDLIANDPIGQALQKIRVEMKGLKEEENQRTWINQGLARFSDILRNKNEIKEYSYQIVSNLVKYMGANQGGLFVEYSDVGERHLQLTACYAYERRKYNESKILEGQGLLGQCMLEKDLIYMTDVPKDYVRITSGLGEATPRCVVVIPLIENEIFYGAIEMASFQVYKPFQLEFLKKVCESIASEIASIKNIQNTQRLLSESNQLTNELQSREEEMRQNLEELSATQEEMARKQAELSGIINAIDSTLATAEFNVQGKIIKYNSAMEEIFGFTNSELCEKDVNMILGQQSDVSFSQILDGRVKGGDFYARCCNKNTVCISTTFTVIHNPGGEVVKVLCLLQNITDKKKQEKEFERLSLVADNTDNSVIITDANGITEYVNDGFTKMTGYLESEIIGKKPGPLLQGVDTDMDTVQRIREKLVAQVPIYEEILNYTKKGEAYWVSIAINPVFDKTGQLEKFISIQANITQTKNAALDFRYKLEAIGRSNAIIEFDTRGTILEANDNFLRLTEYANEEVKGKHHRIFMLPGEAEKPEYKLFWERLSCGEFISDEFNRVTKSGRKIWLRGIYNPIFDMHGKPEKIVKFAVDITEEKRLKLVADRKQRELNSYLDGINNTIASVEFDPKGTFLGANEIFLKVMHYTEAELEGKRFEFFMGDDHTVIMMWENLRLGKFFSGEFRMKDKNGKELWLTGTFNPIKIEGDAPQKVMMFAQFTTQEKEKLNDLNGMVQIFKSALPVVEFTENFDCRTANEKFLKLFGLSRLNLKSKSILDFIDPYYHAAWRKRQCGVLGDEFAVIKLPIKLEKHTATYEVNIAATRNLDGNVSRVVMLLVREVEESVPVLAVG